MKHDDQSMHELLCAYVLGEVNEAERATVEVALAASEELREQRVRLKATIGLVQDAMGEPEVLSESAHGELLDRAGMQPRIPIWARPGLKLAASVLVLVGGAFGWNAYQEAEIDVEKLAYRFVFAPRDEKPAVLMPESGAVDPALGGRNWSSNPTEPSAFGEAIAEGVELPNKTLQEMQVLGYVGQSGGPSASDVDVDNESEMLLKNLGYGGQEESSEPKAQWSYWHSLEDPDEHADESDSYPYFTWRDTQVEAPAGGVESSKKLFRPRQEPARVSIPVAQERIDRGTSGGSSPQPELESFEMLPYDLVDGRLNSEERARGDFRSRADVLITGCRRLPGEAPSSMFFRYWGDRAFEYPISDPLSTFSVDVDTASYALARNYLRSHTIPPKAAVRTEEFVNYFKADVPPPLERDFAIHTDLAPSLFGDEDPSRWMMRVVVRGREVSKQERSSLSLTFVVDTSGSMQQESRMELVKHALRLLVAELDANDSIALVAFSSEARLILPMASVANRSLIEAAINGLQANGSTNAEAGLKLGYAQAVDALREGAGNRVVFLSDGVANVGVTDQNRIADDVRAQRERGVFLNTIGVGMGNHNDNFLEQLADKGDGLCNYIDSEKEAYRAIVENFTGAFELIARDVKIQVEFDPRQVESYRLLGYENRAIADRDFRNDAVDAGEVGAGHQVTALYELVRLSSGPDVELPLATVRLRWKKPQGTELEPAVTEIFREVGARSAAGSFESAPAGYRRAVLVAQFAEFLRRSRHARGDSLDDLIEQSVKLATEVDDPDFDEFVALLQRSRQLIARTLSPADELTRAVDALREHQILIARFQLINKLDAVRKNVEDREFLERLERQNLDLEARIRELIERQMKKR